MFPARFFPFFFFAPRFFPEVGADAVVVTGLFIFTRDSDGARMVFSA